MVLLIFTLKKRKVVGAQDTDGKLFTTGVYSFCRHPIYLGISLSCLGIILFFINIDAFLVYPFILCGNMFTGKIEEMYDISIRFKEEYLDYKKQIRIFGPFWFWMILIGLIIAPILTAFMI